MRWQLLVLTAIVLICLFAPIITPLNPMATDAIHQFQSPDRNHILGLTYWGVMFSAASFTVVKEVC